MRRPVIVIGSLVAIASAASYYAAMRFTEQEVTWTWPLRAPDGQQGFAMILNSRAWRWVSGGPAADWEKTLVSDRTNVRLSGIIAHGFEKVSDGCPTQWQLSEVHPLPNGGVFISAICINAAKTKRPPDSPRRSRL